MKKGYPVKDHPFLLTCLTILVVLAVQRMAPGRSVVAQAAPPSRPALVPEYPSRTLGKPVEGQSAVRFAATNLVSSTSLTNTVREWWTTNAPAWWTNSDPGWWQSVSTDLTNLPPVWWTNVPPVWWTNVPMSWWTNTPPAWWTNVPRVSWLDVPRAWWTNDTSGWTNRPPDRFFSR